MRVIERNSLGSFPIPWTPILGQGEVPQDQGSRQRPYLPADAGFLQEKLLDARPLDHPLDCEQPVLALSRSDLPGPGAAVCAALVQPRSGQEVTNSQSLPKLISHCCCCC